MNITLVTGTGEGPTRLAAFDSALFSAGIANYNLLRLSSVIPPGTIITKPRSTTTAPWKGEWGDRLYAVMAEQHSDMVDTEAWAGIGWVTESATGKGLFVEHEGTSKKDVVTDIEHSLNALIQTRGTDFGEIQMELKGVRCKNKPVCAVVAAVYTSESW